MGDNDAVGTGQSRVPGRPSGPVGSGSRFTACCSAAPSCLLLALSPCLPQDPARRQEDLTCTEACQRDDAGIGKILARTRAPAPRLSHGTEKEEEQEDRAVTISLGESYRIPMHCPPLRRTKNATEKHAGPSGDDILYRQACGRYRRYPAPTLHFRPKNKARLLSSWVVGAKGRRACSRIRRRLRHPPPRSLLDGCLTRYPAERSSRQPTEVSFCVSTVGTHSARMVHTCTHRCIHTFTCVRLSSPVRQVSK